MPQVDHPDDAVSPPPVVAIPAPPTPVEPPKPAIATGDLNRPPTLREYRELAPQGAALLMELAGLLETKGANQRALLAWERVLDMAQPDARQTLLASAACLRLRTTLPDWNTDRAASIAITLHAGTPKKSVKSLTPLIEEIARDLEHASAGILKVTATVTAKRGQPTPPAPVELWLTGPTKKSFATAVHPCPAGSPKSLRDDLLQTLQVMIHDLLVHAAVHTPPAASAAAAKKLDALRGQITRACWQELGTLLNRPQPKHE